MQQSRSGIKIVSKLVAAAISETGHKAAKAEPVFISCLRTEDEVKVSLTKVFGIFYMCSVGKKGGIAAYACQRVLYEKSIDANLKDVLRRYG